VSDVGHVWRLGASAGPGLALNVSRHTDCAAAAVAVLQQQSMPVPQSVSRQQWRLVTVSQLELPRKFKHAQQLV